MVQCFGSGKSVPSGIHWREKSTVDCVCDTLGVVRMGAHTIRTHECSSKFSKIYGELSWAAA